MHTASSFFSKSLFRVYISAQRVGGLSYSILVILTVGEISDLQQTHLELHAAACAPLSVVIIGIGEGNFDEMYSLDYFGECDSNKARDITQFSKFNDYRMSLHSFTEAVLGEIPEQLVEFVLSKKILPLVP